MSDFDGVGLIWGIGALVLVGSAFVARRVPLRDTARLALIWLGIFAVGLAIVSQRERLGILWSDMRGDLLGRDQTIEGATLRVPKSPDGHFWVDARINGRSVRMLVDSGATTTSLSADAARAAGIDTSAGLVTSVSTANGDVLAQRARAERLQVGPMTARDLSVLVADAFGATSVLGMNFLSELEGWRVEGDTLVLTPAAR